MVCWSCEKNAGDGALCAACGAVQPADTRADYFHVLGVERRFAVELPELERRYKELTKVLHPDRFARADARARKASMERSVQVNEAWRTLRDPVRRAEYLLRLGGIDVGAEGGPSRTGSGRLAVPPALLMEVMELREGLAEARAAGDQARVAALAADVRRRRDEAMSGVSRAFAASAPKLDDIAGLLVAVRYHDRFLEEVTAIEEARDAAHGR